MDPDLIILQQFAQRRDQAAFEAIVRRYIDLVYAAALRQVRDPSQAEDVTQAVFVLLARKAGSLGRNVLVGGWLLNATRLVAREVLRAEGRRASHERRAAAMKPESTSTVDPLETSELHRLLDDAMGALSERSRGVLVMQYLEGRSTQELAQVLGLNQNAARKRVSRALDELRQIFAKRGVVLSVEALGAGLVATKITAPQQLIAATTGASVSQPSAAVVTALQGAILAMSIMKAKSLAAAAVVVVILIGGAVGLTMLLQKPDAVSTGLPAPATQPVKMIQGGVRDFEGMPVSDARVLLLTQEAYLNVYNNLDGATWETRTDASGRYSIRASDQQHMLAVVSDAGYAEISPESISKANGDVNLTIKPWGRIDGVTMSGSKPLPNVGVLIWTKRPSNDFRERRMVLQANMRTDDEGRFSFPRVVPGEIALARVASNNAAEHRWEYFILEPGQTRTVKLGGVGRPVIGKAVMPPEAAGRWEWKRDGTHYFQVSSSWDEGGHLDNPVRRPDQTPEEFDAEHELWARTADGRKRLYSNGSIRAVSFDADGTFRFDDQDSGKHTLGVTLYELDPEAKAYEPVLQIYTPFVVPPISSGQTDEPLDLGDVIIPMLKIIKQGTPIAPMNLTTVDGKPWSLADCRGKPLAILFITPTFDGSLSEFLPIILPHVKAGRMAAMVAVLDMKEEKAKAAAAKANLDLPVVWMTVPEWRSYFPNTNANSLVLIDHEGLAIERPQRDQEQIRKLIQQALEGR